jgi:ComF family protein
MTLLIHYLKEYLFPPKCILCDSLLEGEQTDLCRRCRAETDSYPQGKLKLQFIDRAAAVWYYKDNVRKALHRYKFRRARFLAEPFGKLMAMKVLTEDLGDADIVTWVPVSRKRLRRRGYDQAGLIAGEAAKLWDTRAVPLLKKTRDTPTQSKKDAAARRANVLGAFAPQNEERIKGSRILLIDDVRTTGATLGECAGVLRRAGAAEVVCAVLATPRLERK